MLALQNQAQLNPKYTEEMLSELSMAGMPVTPAFERQR